MQLIDNSANGAHPRAERSTPQNRRGRATTGLVRVILACMRKDIKSVLTERAFMFQTIVLPLNYNLLLILFVLAGSNAPTAVVMQDSGPYAQQFYTALSGAHSFHLQQASAAEAQQLLNSGEIVAIVTIPPDFDRRLQARQAVQIGLAVNNLNTDMTDDVRRGTRLAITSFYSQAFPGQVPIVPEEHDAYLRDTGYIPFLSIPVLVIGLMVGGLLQAGTASAREWDKQTVKELLLSPAPSFAIAVGKMLAAGVMSLASSLVVLAFVILVIGDWPLHPLALFGLIPLVAAVFVAAGTLLGSLLRQRQTVTLLVRGIGLPLFFLSGIFAPIGFSTPAVQVLARLFPIHYSIALLQYAFEGFRTNTLGVANNVLVLCAFLVILLASSALALRRRSVAP